MATYRGDIGRQTDDFVLHDFAFVCLNKGARRRHKNCNRQCFSCGLSSKVRLSLTQGRPDVRLVAPSAAHAEAVQALANRALNISVIHNPNVYDVKTRIRQPVGRLQFGYVGRLEEDKGFGTFLALARRFGGRAVFIAAGEGAMAHEAQMHTASNHIRYLGQVTKSEMNGVYDSLDVLLVPSKWRENFPGVCVEAVLAGLPVLGAHMGGIPEVITDGSTGRLLPPDDLESWAVAVEDLIVHPELVTAYSSNAAAEGRRFDPAVSFSKYRKLIEEMIANSAI